MQKQVTYTHQAHEGNEQQMSREQRKRHQAVEDAALEEAQCNPSLGCLYQHDYLIYSKDCHPQCSFLNPPGLPPEV